jgi:hypothetical protein
MKRTLDHVPYWAYCAIVLTVGMVCFALGRAS